jgi:cytochrome-b5 reductase
MYSIKDLKTMYDASTSCIVIIKGIVYDVTPFLEQHPGGAAILREYHCSDASSAFSDVGHSSEALKILDTYKIGTLKIE